VLILWFLVTKKEPYEEYDDLDTFSHAVCIQHIRPVIPLDTIPSLAELIKKCWDPNPAARPSFSEIVLRLDHIIVDLAIEDPFGRQFWKDHFLAKFSVPWTEFLNQLAKFLTLVEDTGMPFTDVLVVYKDALKQTTLDIDVKCFKAILAEESRTQGTDNEEQVVSIEKCGAILQYLGPLTPRPYLPDGINILQRTRQLLVEPWFHGNISTHESESNLISKPAGTFLVRFSTSSPGCYTISKVSLNDNSIKHQKIQHKSGAGFEINGKTYKSLQELVKTESQDLNLYTACTGSRFLSLFIEQRISGYVN